MKLIIDIPDEIYNAVKKYNYFDTHVMCLNVIKKMIKNGVPFDLYMAYHKQENKTNYVFVDDVLTILDKENKK